VDDLIAKLGEALDETERLAERQVAAHRKILEIHTPTKAVECQVCLELGGSMIEPVMMDWPCPTLLALAEAYGIEDGADHE
jgi:hypothetical protein